MGKNRDKKIPGGRPPELSKKAKLSPESNEKASPKWRFRRFDWHGPYCLSAHGTDVISEILKKLGAFETMTWNDIKSQPHGSSGKSSSHYISYDKLTKAGQRRFKELGLFDEYCDMLFSLRLSGAQRIFGLLEDNILDILWYDPNHEIAETSR